MPMIPEAAVAMLACARIGADPLGRVRRLLARLAARPHQRLRRARCVITADEGLRGGKKVPLKANVDEALSRACRGVETRARGASAPAATSHMDGGPRRLAGTSDGRRQRADCPPEWMDAEDPLFILYTSGSHRQAQGRAAHHRRLPACTPRSRTSTSSTTTTATSTGARPTSAGSPATATSSTARWPTARPRVMFEGVPDLPRRRPLLAGDRQAQGQRSSTPRRPRSAR
ncbi:MAG: hypothetical protein MZV49_22875 [Rhodopseudomonas palustris]|nr:hypothetical protein [Rhodopseudomonas palustris]